MKMPWWNPLSGSRRPSKTRPSVHVSRRLAYGLPQDRGVADQHDLAFRPLETALLAGKVDYFCSSVAAIKPHIEAGRLKAPAVLSRARLPSLPGVATAQEQGVKDFEASNWMALFLPSATPEPIVARLNAAAIAALADPTLQAKLRALGAEPAATERNTPVRLAVFLAADASDYVTGQVIAVDGGRSIV